MRGQILEVASEILNVPQEELRIENGVVHAPNGKKLTYGQICDRSLYSRNQHQIMAEASHISYSSPPPFSAHFAEVEVDTETGMVRVVKYVAATDCGTAIHPALAEGQSDGAILNGITYALTEEYVFNSKGRMLNPTFADYKIYSSSDMPEIKTILVPSYEPTGPYGAKSIAEININGPLPAISNAIKDAVGIRLRYAPFTPEKLLRAMKGL
ncbi:MAG: molybdopterin cofactor-binding domain-containing protein [bacterium]